MAKKHDKNESPNQESAKTAAEPTIPPDAQEPAEASAAADAPTATEDPGDPPSSGTQDESGDLTPVQKAATFDSVSTAELVARFVRDAKLISDGDEAEARMNAYQDALCRRYLSAGAGSEAKPAKIGDVEYRIKKLPARSGGGYHFVALAQRGPALSLA